MLAVIIPIGGGDQPCFGDYAVVSGGKLNAADGHHSMVGGGTGNVVQGQWSAIVGQEKQLALMSGGEEIFTWRLRRKEWGIMP